MVLYIPAIKDKLSATLTPILVNYPALTDMVSGVKR